MRILVVEDEKEIVDGLMGILKNQGFLVDAAYDGEDGLEFILSGVYDIILMDVMLPGINGFDILKKVRDAGVSTPVILITSKSQIEDKI